MNQEHKKLQMSGINQIKKELDTALLCNHTLFGRFTIHGLCVQHVVIRILEV